MIRNNIESAVPNIKELVPEIAAQVVFLIFGFSASRSAVLSAAAPFGIGFVAGVPITYMFSSAVGALLGYIFPVTGAGVFKYLFALFGVVLLRHLTKNLKMADSAVFGSVFAAAPLLVSALPSALSREKLIITLCEAILAAASAYFFRLGIRFPLSANLYGIDRLHISAMVISLNILLTGFMGVYISSLSVGKILAFALILSAAHFGASQGGTVAGTAAGIAVWLTVGGDKALLLYPIAGLIAGMFRSLGKLSASAVCLIVFALNSALNAFSSESTVLLLEALIGAAIYIAVPRTVLKKVGTAFAPRASYPTLDGLKKALTMRLSFASATLKGVCETVENVGTKLEPKEKNDFGDVLEKVECTACTGCALRRSCWEKERTKTLEAMLIMGDTIRIGQSLTIESLPESFVSKCMRLDRITEVFSEKYRAFAERRTAVIRMDEMRGIVCDSFAGISDMLSSLSSELEAAQTFDTELATRLTDCLKKDGLSASLCAVSVDENERLSVELKLLGPPEMPINRLKIKLIAEEALERSFAPPTVSRSAGEILITLSESADFAVDCYIAKILPKGNKMCGDTAEIINDGRGKEIIILSDGMGQGGRAAVDSAMASSLMSRLIRAGFGYECALRLLNSAMQFKSSDESLATLDIAAIDLFTGQTNLYKAGAAPTVVKHSGRTGRARCSSLPAGILRDTTFDKAVVMLKKDDIILMMSDGATANGTDWICEELKSYTGTDPKIIAERISKSAARRRTDGKEDDITVIAAVVRQI